MNDAPTVVFCPREKAQALSCITGLRVMTPRTMIETLALLDSGESIIVTDEHILLMGWVAPPGTNMLFIEGFPEKGSAVRIQAEGRCRYETWTPHHVRLKLDKRIHNQRMALRENWMIVEQRAKWIGKTNREIVKQVSDLCSRFGIPKNQDSGMLSLKKRIVLLEEKLKILTDEECENAQLTRNSDMTTEQEIPFTPALNTGTPIDQLNGVGYASEDKSMSYLNGGLGRITLIYGLPNTYKSTLAMNLIVGAAERFPGSELIIINPEEKAVSHENIAKYSRIEGSGIIDRCASFGIEEVDTSFDYFVKYLEDLANKKLAQKEELTIDTEIYNPYTKSLHRMLVPTFVLIDNWESFDRDSSISHLEFSYNKHNSFVMLYPTLCAANIYLVVTTNTSRNLWINPNKPRPNPSLPTGFLAVMSSVALRVDTVIKDNQAETFQQAVTLTRCQWSESYRETVLEYRSDGLLVLNQ